VRERNPAAGPERVDDGAPTELDLRGEECPYTFLKAKLALEPLPPGARLRVVVDNDTSARDVPRSLAGAGHRVLGIEPGEAGIHVIVVERGGP
jgi:tRNA 2-thiouridine synthesizing protein A